MAERRVDAARRQAGRRGALFRARAGARLGGTAVSGRLFVIGLGPGNPAQMTPEASAAIGAAREFFGYGPYLDRARPEPGPGPPRLRQPRGAGPRRARRWSAPRTASGGAWSPAAIPASSPWPRRSARRSRTGRPNGARSSCRSCPGVTAMLAVAARVGAPLGHDFCAISLSDNLKPWELIERRLEPRPAPAS